VLYKSGFTIEFYYLSSGTGNLLTWKGPVNAERYLQVLEPHLLPSRWAFSCSIDFGSWDLQITEFCSYWHVTQRPNSFGTGVVLSSVMAETQREEKNEAKCYTDDRNKVATVETVSLLWLSSQQQDFTNWSFQLNGNYTSSSESCYISANDWKRCKH